jgi:Zn-dependent protease with chaperone function
LRPIAGAAGPPYRDLVIRRSSAALALSLVISGCVLPPAGPSRSPYPRSRASTDDEITQESSVLRERAQARFLEQKRRVERVGRRLLETIPDHPKVQFVIANGDPSINAGASFGQVAITSGMLNFVKSDDEMAVVLGHELAHIEQGHVLKGAISGLALGVLSTVLEARVPGAGQAAGGVGQMFLNHFTQNQEREADDVGLRFAYQAGYDPRVAAGLQERLAVEVPQSMSAGYFDSHPSSVERAVAARREADELLARGDPPGRQEVLALERADERSADSVRERERGGRSFTAAREPAADARSGVGSRGGESEGCQRAAVYAEMARDARDPAERKELYERARRYCPTLAEAREGQGTKSRRRDDESGPGEDTY